MPSKEGVSPFAGTACGSPLKLLDILEHSHSKVGKQRMKPLEIALDLKRLPIGGAQTLWDRAWNSPDPVARLGPA
jgi:hypothetical protein